MERPGKGRTLDELTEALIELEYVQPGQHGSGVDQSLLADLLDRAESGEIIYSMAADDAVRFGGEFDAPSGRSDADWTYEVEGADARGNAGDFVIDTDTGTVVPSRLIDYDDLIRLREEEDNAARFFEQEGDEGVVQRSAGEAGLPERLASEIQGRQDLQPGPADSVGTGVRTPEGGRGDQGSDAELGGFSVRQPKQGDIVDVDGKFFGDTKDLEQLRRKARDYAQANYVAAPKTVKVTDAGEDVIVNWQGLKHAIAKAPTATELQVIRDIPALLQNSKKTGFAEDLAARRNVKGFHYYEAAARIDGKLHKIKMVVREDLSGKRFYDHTAEITALVNRESAGISGEHRGSQLPDGSHQPAADSNRSIDDAGKISQPGRDVSPAGRVELLLPESAQPAERVAATGSLGPRVRHAEVGNLPSGLRRVQSAEDVAHVIAPIRKDAQESVLAVVTDNDGNVLRIARIAGGAENEASVDPAIIAGTVTNTPGGTRAWIAHNHPGGNIRQSDADAQLTAHVADLLRGTDRTLEGSVVVGPGGRLHSSLGGFNEAAA